MDQTNLIPPVASDILKMLPLQIVVSSYARNAVAVLSLRSAKFFLCIRASLTEGAAAETTHFFSKDLDCGSLNLGFEMGLAHSSPELLESSRSIPPIFLVTSSRHCCFLGDTSFFAGEWRSVQSLTTSGFHKASRLGRKSGAFGMRGFFFEGENTVVETGTPQATIEGLKARGHKVIVTEQPWGGAQTIKIDWDRGVLIAGSEPRKDGSALGF